MTRRDLGAALAHALEWWRDTPAPALAEQVLRLEALIPDAERDPLPARLSAVMVGGNSVKSRANVEALSSLRPDPRLTDFLIRLLGAPPWDLTGSNPEAWARAVAELLVRQPDPRVRTFLAGLEGFFQAHAGSRVGQLSRDEMATLRAIFSALEPAPSPAIPPTAAADVEAFAAALEPLLRAKQSVAGRREHLLADVIAHFDDARLQVYADWLQEQGAPQGELIARMLAGETKDLTALQARARPACFVGAILTWERGLPVKALFANRDGVRSGSWGPELEWGTIRETDLVPGDGCHAERLETLHIGNSFVKDLAKRTEPLGVKTLVMLSLPSSLRPAWKKVTTLGQVVRLELRVHDEPAALLWLLDTPTGKQVEHVAIQYLNDGLAGYVGRARDLFAASKLKRLELGALTFARRGAELECRITLDSRAHKEDLVRRLATTTRPCCDVVVLVGSPLLTDAPALASLGVRAEVEDGLPAVISRVTLTQVGDLARVEVPHDLGFDHAALKALLSSTAHPPARLDLSAVDFRETGAMWATASAHGVTELTLHRKHGSHELEKGLHAWWHADSFRLTLRDGELDAEGGWRAAELLRHAVQGLRVRRATVRVPAGLSTTERSAIDAALKPVADSVEVVDLPPESQLALKYVKSKKRLEVYTRRGAPPLTPQVLDQVLAKYKAVDLVDVLQPTLELVPWFGWVATTRRSIEFRLPDQFPSHPIRVWWADGVHVRLSLRPTVAGLPAALKQLPAKSLASFEFVHHEPPDARWREAMRHVASTSSATRPQR